MTDIGEIALIFMSVRDQLKIYHWQTSSFARHKASDNLVGIMTELMDKFIETMQGTYGKRLRMPTDNRCVMDNQSDSSIVEVLNRFKMWLINNLPSFLNSGDTDLLNIRDEILGSINQTLYLFTFR